MTRRRVQTSADIQDPSPDLTPGRQFKLISSPRKRASSLRISISDDLQTEMTPPNKTRRSSSFVSSKRERDETLGKDAMGYIAPLMALVGFAAGFFMGRRKSSDSK